MRYISFCSGVEAASQAWEPLGWEPVAFSEIEPFPCAVLASRYPNVPNLGDCRNIHYDQTTKELYVRNSDGVVSNRFYAGDIDLCVGGFPCQSFSVAGKRAGLEGASGLVLEYFRLLAEIRPRWVVYENVPGMLSSNGGRDFRLLLRCFAKCGYDLCWRTLDTQYVRVESFPRAIPQRRRRVFIVGHLATDCRGGCEVLLEPEGVSRHTPPRRVKGQGTAGDFEKGAGGVDGAFGVVHGSMDPISNPCECANTIGRNDGAENCVAMKQTNAVGHENGVAIAYDGYNQTAHDECTFPLRTANGSEGDDRTVKVAVCVKTANTKSNGDNVNQSGAAYTIDGANGQAVMKQQNYVALLVAMRGNRTPTDRGKFPETDGSGAAYSLTSVQTDSMVGVRTDAKAILDMQGGKIGANYTMGDGAVPAITRGRGSADDVHSIAIGIDPYNSCSTGGVSKTINSAADTDKDHIGAVAIGIGHGNQGSMTAPLGNVAPSLTSNDYKGPMPAVAIKDNYGQYARMANH